MPLHPDIAQFIDDLNRLHAETTWLGHVSGSYLSSAGHSKLQHDGMRKAGADVKAAANDVVRSVERLIKFAKQAEKAAAVERGEA